MKIFINSSNKGRKKKKDMTMMDLFSNSYNQIINTCSSKQEKLLTCVDHISIFILIKAHFLPFYIVLCYFVMVCSN